MFYSHEILTSRKHGVATIWLVATLGSKSALKKVNRKAINEVNVPKACEVILAPQAPMALRLQSQLLYGVSRVYSQQCGYVLLDAQNTHSSMRQMLKSVREVGNDRDPKAARTRPDLLLVQDDPAFVPDLAFSSLALTLDLPALDFSISTQSSAGVSSLYSPHGRKSSRGGSPGIRIPSSASEASVGRLSLGDTSSISRPMGRDKALLHPDDDELGFLPEAGFGFDADGNLFDIETPAPATRADQALGRSGRAGSDSAVVERVRREHENARLAAVQVSEQNVVVRDEGTNAEKRGDFDLDMNDLPPIDDDYAMPTGAEPFPERNASEPSPSLRGEHGDNDPDYADAPMTRNTRTATKIIKLDSDSQLRNSTIADWNTKYLDNMAKELAQKVQRAAPALAKKNAEYWIWGSGIGGIGRDEALLGALDPLAIFYGDALKERMTGVVSGTTGRKRGRSIIESDGQVEEARRVRSRGESAEARPGENSPMFGDDDDGQPPFGDDEDLEVGRKLPTPTPGDASREGSSIMPWNLSASQRSSTLQQGLRTGLLSRAGSTGSATAQTQLLRGRQAPSTSPLMNRGIATADRMSNRDTLDPSMLMQGPAEPATPSAFGGGDDGAFGMPGADDVSVQHGSGAFTPRGNRELQMGQDSDRIRAALDNDSVNFLAFVQAACATADEWREDNMKTVDFDTLLPPETNSKMVAAQALLQCLSLASKRLLNVVQVEYFGPISLGLVV